MVGKGILFLTSSLERAAVDTRLCHCHIALLMAIGLCGIDCGVDGWFHVSRRKLTAYSKLRAKGTYHKYLSHLVNLGYIYYLPSYDPVLGSRIKLVVDDAD